MGPTLETRHRRSSTGVQNKQKSEMEIVVRPANIGQRRPCSMEGNTSAALAAGIYWRQYLSAASWSGGKRRGGRSDCES